MTDAQPSAAADAPQAARRGALPLGVLQSAGSRKRYVARGFMGAFPDMEASMDELSREPHGTAFHWTLTGTSAGAGGAGKRVRYGVDGWMHSVCMRTFTPGCQQMIASWAHGAA